MRVLVTGGNGFTGSHFVDRLLTQQHHVRCLVRSTGDRRWLEGKPIELQECAQVGDPGVIAKAVEGVDAVVHFLGTLVAPTLEAFRLVNVEPVRLFLEQCAAQPSPPRFVLIGSHGAAGPNPDGVEAIDEACPCHPISAYGQSKLEAEHVVREFHDRVPCTTLRLSAMYGPRDENFLKMFRSAVSKGYVPQLGPVPKHVTLGHVTDVCEGIYQSAIREHAIGQTYFLGSEAIYGFEDLANALDALLERDVKVRVVPDWLVKMLMLYSDLLAVFGKHILLNRDRLTTLAHASWVCDISKAKHDLDYRQTIGFEDGVRETFNWYQAAGWLK